jgi:hypothetical protein
MTIRLLTIITVVSLTILSGTAGARDSGWNQVAADEAARAYAAEGKCYPLNGPCSAPTLTAQPLKHPHRTMHKSR